MPKQLKQLWIWVVWLAACCFSACPTGPVQSDSKTTNMYMCRKQISTRVEIKLRLTQFDLTVHLEFTKYINFKRKQISHSMWTFNIKRVSWRLMRRKMKKKCESCICYCEWCREENKCYFAWQPLIFITQGSYGFFFLWLGSFLMILVYL